MSYTSGFSTLQQTIDSVAPTNSKSPVQASESNTPITAVQPSTADVDHADKTNLSSTGGLVVQALASSDVRFSKVASLQQAIGNGTYSVSSFDVADKLMQSLLD
jgi:negative regulator of flagellin synthesis FlgM